MGTWTNDGLRGPVSFSRHLVKTLVALHFITTQSRHNAGDRKLRAKAAMPTPRGQCIRRGFLPVLTSIAHARHYPRCSPETGGTPSPMPGLRRPRSVIAGTAEGSPSPGVERENILGFDLSEARDRGLIDRAQRRRTAAFMNGCRGWDAWWNLRGSLGRTGIGIARENFHFRNVADGGNGGRAEEPSPDNLRMGRTTNGRPDGLLPD